MHYNIISYGVRHDIFLTMLHWNVYAGAGPEGGNRRSEGLLRLSGPSLSPHETVLVVCSLQGTGIQYVLWPKRTYYFTLEKLSFRI